MTLRARTLLLIGLLMVSLVAALSVTARQVILESFARLEGQAVREHVHRAVNGLKDDVAGLESTCADWAYWDDAYRFMRDRNRSFIRSNFLPETCKNLRVGGLALLDASGKLVAGIGYDLVRQAAEPVPAALLRQLERANPLGARPGASSRASGVVIAGQPFLVSCLPVLTSDSRGPARGTMVVYRKLDRLELKRLSDLTELSLRVRTAADPALPADFRWARDVLRSAGDLPLRPLDGQRMAGYAAMDDVYGKPALLLRVERPRRDYAQAQRTVSYFVGSLVLVAVVFCGATLLLMERLVLARITRLSADLENITSSGDLSVRVPVSGKDELCRLGAAVNGLLHALEHANRQRRFSSDALREAHETLRAVVDGSPAAIIAVDVQDRVTVWNPAAERVLGWSRGEVVGRRSPLLLDQADEEARQLRERVLAGETRTDVEIRQWRRDGSAVDLSLSAAPLHDRKGAVDGAVFMATDVTERKRQEHRIEHLSMHDPLTNLPNRRALEEHLEQAVQRARPGRPGALLFCDLDNFKLVNDTQGHPCGDQFLVSVAERINSVLRSGDFLARLGGDEFAILLQATGSREAEELAERLRRTIGSHQFAFQDRTLDAGLSIGIVHFDGRKDAQTVMVLADSAMSAAKEEGKNRVVVYNEDAASGSRAAAASQWAMRIKDALREGRFEIHFQPVVRLATGQVEHLEALVRLRDEPGEVILPGAFIAAAERFGLMPQVDRYVIDSVLRRTPEFPGRRLLINLSGHSLGDPSLLEFIERRLREEEIAPGRVIFEVTETAALRDLLTARSWMSRLRDRGCHFALDDFGMGFSSFSYLRSLPAEYVKIDGTFTRNLDTDATGQAIVRTITAIAHVLGKEVIAECVETPAAAAYLKEIGVDFGQGRYWGLPAPSEPAAVAADNNPPPDL